MRKALEIKQCMKTFEGDGIPVTRAFPVPGMRENDPFLLFDHFGPINYEPGGATGVPAHPHCGFEAITYMLGGEVEHRDSFGGQAEIETGDVQWMTTGSGLIHSELVTEKFKKSIYQTARDMVDLEDKFIDLAFSMGGIRGLNPEEVKQYIRYIADRRLLQLSLKPNYGVKHNPLGWLDWVLNGVEHANFFENRATEYNKGTVTGDLWK